MKANFHSLAGTTADGAPVYFAKKDPDDLRSTTLAHWVTLDPEHYTAHGRVSLATLGLPSGGYCLPLPGETRPETAQRTAAALVAFLCTIPAALVEAHANAQELAALGEPFPDVAACLAFSHTAADLASSTRDSLSHARALHGPA